MAKQKRTRFAGYVYNELARILEVIENSAAFPEAACAIGELFTEISNRTQVCVDHPAIARAFYLEAHRAMDKLKADERARTCDLFRAAASIAHFAAVPTQIDRIMQREGFGWLDEESDEPAELPAPAPPHLAPVVDLNLWRQAHPRPVRNLLFAEKGGRANG